MKLTQKQKELIAATVALADSIEAWYAATQSRPRYRTPLVNGYTGVAADFVRKYTTGRIRELAKKSETES